MRPPNKRGFERPVYYYWYHIKKANCELDLGVWTNYDLTWSKQVTQQSNKANKMLSYIRRSTLNICEYLSLVRSHLRPYSKSWLTLTLNEWRFNQSFSWLSVLFLNTWRVSVLPYSVTTHSPAIQKQHWQSRKAQIETRPIECEWAFRIQALGYATQIWATRTVELVKNVERVQRRVTKYIFNVPFIFCETDYRDRLLATRLLPLSYRHEYLDV
jgi:hypothetical protein